MIRLTPTPASTAGVPGGGIDRRDPRLNQAGAIGIILATYLLITARPILGSFQVGINNLVMQPTDYSSFATLLDLTTRLSQIGGTVLILVLICRWLGIRRDLAGFPRHKEVSPTPAVLTVGICILGLVISGFVLNALTPDNANTNSNGGGSVDNGWGWLQIIEALHTSIVEEIIVVAVPVLIGRRAGWHPAVVIAVCAFLRWPYHTYHGTLSTLPWALIWGGAYAAAYLYLRRLTPIIVVHILYDLRIMLADVTPWADAITNTLIAALVLWTIAWQLTDRRRRVQATNQPTLIHDRQAQRFLLRHNKRGLIGGVIVAALAALLAVTLIIDGIFFEPAELLTALSLAAAIIAVVAILLGAVWRLFRDSNVYVSPGSGEEITGAVRWHPNYMGENVIDETPGVIDALAAVTHIAASNPDAVVNYLPPKDQEHLWEQLGCRTRGRPFNRQLRVHVRFDPVSEVLTPAQSPSTPAYLESAGPNLPD